MPSNGARGNGIRRKGLGNSPGEFIRTDNQDVDPGFVARSVSGPHPRKYRLHEQSEQEKIQAAQPHEYSGKSGIAIKESDCENRNVGGKTSFKRSAKLPVWREMILNGSKFIVFRNYCPKKRSQKQQAKVRGRVNITGVMRDQVCRETEIASQGKSGERHQVHDDVTSEMRASESAEDHDSMEPL